MPIATQCIYAGQSPDHLDLWARVRGRHRPDLPFCRMAVVVHPAVAQGRAAVERLSSLPIVSDQKQPVTWHSRLRWFSGQVGINVLAGWVGGLLLAGFGWLKSPAHWQTFISMAGSAGVVAGVMAFILSLRWKQMLAVSALCLGFAACLSQ